MTGFLWFYIIMSLGNDDFSANIYLSSIDNFYKHLCIEIKVYL